MDDKFVQLFVGHKKFVVSKDTLLKHKGSYFAKLLSENFTDRKNDIIYIDRDRTHFNAILNHLRGCLDLDEWRTKDLRKLAIEANYYSLTRLEKQINSAIVKRPLVQNTPARIGTHLLNQEYEKLIERLKSHNRKVFVIFVRSGNESLFAKYLQDLEESCLRRSDEIELTFIYDAYPNQKIQMFHPEKGFFINVCTICDMNLSWQIPQHADKIFEYQKK